MGLTQKFLLFTSLLVVALVGATLAFTTVQADRLAHETITGPVRHAEVWETFRPTANKLKLGISVLGNDPGFKALVETNDRPTSRTSRERAGLKADFFIATDPRAVIAHRPADRGRPSGIRW
jgi:hypothetical protein